MTNNNHGVAAVDDTNNKDLSIEESGNALPLSVIGDADTLIRCIEEAHLEANRSFADSVLYARRAGDAAIQLKASGEGTSNRAHRRRTSRHVPFASIWPSPKSLSELRRHWHPANLEMAVSETSQHFCESRKQALPSPKRVDSRRGPRRRQRSVHHISRSRTESLDHPSNKVSPTRQRCCHFYVSSDRHLREAIRSLESRGTGIQRQP